MDIRAAGGYPGRNLSNFAGHSFVFDDVQCASMEGLVQAFKSPYEHIQVEICKLVGMGAKRRGSKIDWKTKQTLYWKGKEYYRLSDEYQHLLNAAYNAMYEQCESFRDALAATGKATLTHTIGKTKESETIMTQREFTSRLTKLRDFGKL